MKDTFLHYLLAGHGRCFSLLRKNPEAYRELVLDACTHDISFDMQCEGSRAWLVYHLTLQYEDYQPFLTAAIRRYLQSDIDTDWHEICHLTDLLDLYASERQEAAAQAAIEQKYHDLYLQLMTGRWSQKSRYLLESFEYPAIVLMQQGDWSRTVSILHDIGAWYQRRRRADAQDLKWDFSWFVHNLTECVPDWQEKLSELCKTSGAIRRFVRIQSLPEPEDPPKLLQSPFTSAEEIRQAAEEGTVSRPQCRRLPDEELQKLAGIVLQEPDAAKKALLLQAFTFRRQPWPLKVEPLLKYADAACEPLRQTARDALTYVQSPLLYDFAEQHLQAEPDSRWLEMLLQNLTPAHTDEVLSRLQSLAIDRENRSGWHDVTLCILNAAERKELPEALFWWIYEQSLCSCCRESAVQHLLDRKAFTEQALQECLHDGSQVIRELAEQAISPENRAE